MTRPAITLPVNFRRKNYYFAVFLLWFVGLIIGFCLSFIYKPYYFLPMRSVLFQPVSIIGLFCVVFIPLLCTYFSSALKPILVFIVCFLKAVAFGFSYVWVSLTFESASWLIRILFLFSDYCSLLILLILLIRCADYLHCLTRRDFLFATAFDLMVVIGDYFFLSPFRSSIF